MSSEAADRDPLEALVDEYALLCRSGSAPTIHEFASQHPQWTEQLNDLLPTVAKIENLKFRRRHSLGATLVAPRKLERLGDYRIIREIGRGGMGIVYEAEQESLHRRVALKVLPDHSMLDPKRLERARREAQTAAQLHHTNIVPIFGVGEHEGLHYIVMQYIAGRGLDELLAHAKQAPTVDLSSPLPANANGQPETVTTGQASPASDWRAEPAHWRRIAKIGHQVADALAHAHLQSVLHRDIKPANLLLDAHDHVWVVDFGLAKVSDAPQVTSHGNVIGTLQYLAPELLDGQSDARSDIYALGLTLYELATGRPTIESGSPGKMLQQIRHGEPASPRKLCPTIPRDLETIILKAIRPEPSHRYQSAEELAEDLHRYLWDEPILARRLNPLERAWRWCRRNRLTAALLALLFVVGLGGVVGIVWNWHEAVKASRDYEDMLRLSLGEVEELLSNVPGADELPLAPNEIWRPLRLVTRAVPPEEARKSIELLQSLLQFYDQLHQRTPTNRSLQQQVARAQRKVSSLQLLLRREDEARQSNRQAVATLEELIGSDPTDPFADEYRFELAKTLLTNIPAEDPARAEQDRAEGISLANDLLHGVVLRNPDRESYRLYLARTERELAEIAESQGDPEGAIELYQSTIDELLPLIQSGNEASALRVNLATTQTRLAVLCREQGDAQRAETLLQGAIGSFEQVLKGRLIGNRPAIAGLVGAYRELAKLRLHQGKTESAAAISAKADELAPNSKTNER